jgi:hypothetical protein
MFSIKKIFIIPVFLLLMTSCDPLDKLGPELCPSDDFSFKAEDLKIEVITKSGKNYEFSTLESKSNTIDLNGEGIKVSAQFSEKVKWELEIVMDDKSSSKLYKGEGDSMNVFWYGNSSKMPLFSAGKAKLTFNILCLEKVVQDFNLLNSPSFKDLHPNYGIMIRDWDQNGDFPIANLESPNFDWGTGDGFLWADTASAKVKYINSDPSPMGGNYLNLYSKESAPDWYHFATGINKSGLDDNVDRLPTYNPDSIYLNFYARGNQEYKNTSLELVYNCNESGIYTEHLNWEGWKLVSIPLSEFKVGTAPLSSVEGLNYIAIQLGCQPLKDDEAQYDIDFLLLTVGSPFLDE